MGLIGTLENVRLTEGDMVRAHIGAKVYTAKILDADDPSKLLVELDNGRTVWVGRRAVVNLVTDD